MKSIIFLCLLFIELIYSDNSIESYDVQPQVSIKTGSIKGKTVSFRGIQVNQFLGIPFGQPLTGLSRFKKPKPAQPWEGVLLAHEYGPKCTQSQIPLSGRKLTEDCLYLNVFETSSALIDYKNGTNKLRPVMVWIHGGGFNHGAANLPDVYDGTILSALHDVIIVSINYRLSQFGFLYLPEHGVPGNMAFWDQRLALEWVQENIKYFGGDPGQVTIFGESAGGMSVSAHVISPQSKGLFKNAIIQSGAIYSTNIIQKPWSSNWFLQALNCTSPDEIEKCLSSYEYGENVDADSMMLIPIIGDEFLPDSPENIIYSHGFDPNVHILMGTVDNEGASLMASQVDPLVFNPYHPANLTLAKVKQILSSELPFINGSYSVDYIFEKYFTNVTDDSDELRLKVCKAFGDMLITCPTYIFGRELVKNGHSNVYAYYQTQKPVVSMYPFIATGSWLPATHADDIPFVFGDSLKENETFDREETIISTIMMKVWTDFAKSGEPGLIGGQQWPAWREADGQFFNPTIDLNSRRVGQFESTHVDFCFNNWPLLQ